LEIIFLAKIDFLCMMTKELQKKSFSIRPRLLKIKLDAQTFVETCELLNLFSKYEG